MHGHQLRLLAEQEHLHHWTDISVGALYGAMKRLATEGLVAVVRTEREGSYPERHVYGITASGRVSLAALQHEGLEQIVFKADPVDLALSRADPDRLDGLGEALSGRLTRLREMLHETDLQNERARPFLSVGEAHALLHRSYRLQAEINWHENLIGALPEVIADERARALVPEPLPTIAPRRAQHQPKDPS